MSQRLIHVALLEHLHNATQVASLSPARARASRVTITILLIAEVSHNENFEGALVANTLCCDPVRLWD